VESRQEKKGGRKEGLDYTRGGIKKTKKKRVGVDDEGKTSKMATAGEVAIRSDGCIGKGGHKNHGNQKTGRERDLQGKKRRKNSE